MSDKFTDEELMMEIGGPILDRICALRERANIYDTPREAEGDRAEADRQESALAEIRRRLALRKVSREFIEDLCVVARAHTNVLDSIADVTELLAGCGIEVEVEKP